MTWDDLTKALNNLTDDVSYITMDDDGYVTLKIGKIDTVISWLVSESKRVF